VQTQNVHPRPNQRPFLTHRRAQIFKLLHQQERVHASPYLLRPDQQVPSLKPALGKTNAQKPRIQRRSIQARPALQKNLFDAVSPHLKTLKKKTKPTAQTVPILLEEAKASLLRYAQKPRSKFGFLGF
jgi:hypothetical protein